MRVFVGLIVFAFWGCALDGEPGGETEQELQLLDAAVSTQALVQLLTPPEQGLPELQCANTPKNPGNPSTPGIPRTPGTPGTPGTPRDSCGPGSKGCPSCRLCVGACRVDKNGNVRGTINRALVGDIPLSSPVVRLRMGASTEVRPMTPGSTSDVLGQIGTFPATVSSATLYYVARRSGAASASYVQADLALR